MSVALPSGPAKQSEPDRCSTKQPTLMLKERPTEERASDNSSTTECPGTEKLMKKKEKLEEQIKHTKFKVEHARKELEEASAKLGDVDPTARVQRHIKLLHQYNEIKDTGMGLFGLIAERRGVRVKDVFEEFGVGEKD